MSGDSPERLRQDIEEQLIKRVERFEEEEAKLLKGSDEPLKKILEEGSRILSHIDARKEISDKRTRIERMKRRAEGADRQNLELCEEAVDRLEEEIERMREIIDKGKRMLGDKSEKKIREKLFNEYKRDYKLTEQLGEMLEEDWK